LIVHNLTQYSAFFQLYVAASRVGNPDHIKFALREKRLGGEYKTTFGVQLSYNWTPNVVYKDALLHCHSSQAEGERQNKDGLASSVTHVDTEDDYTKDDYDGPYDAVLEDCEEQEVDFNPRQRIKKQQGARASRSASLPKNVTPTQPEEWHPTVDGPLSEYEKIRENNICERKEGWAALTADDNDPGAVMFKQWVLRYTNTLDFYEGKEVFPFDGFMEFLFNNQSGAHYTEVVNIKRTIIITFLTCSLLPTHGS
jgi:hypothetical protein